MLLMSPLQKLRTCAIPPHVSTQRCEVMIRISSILTYPTILSYPTSY